MPDSPVAPSDALRQVEAALREISTLDGVPRIGITADALLKRGVCVSMDALLLLPALAQQIEEGERSSGRIADFEDMARLRWKQSGTDAPFPGPLAAYDMLLAATREALAVAELTLQQLRVNACQLTDFMYGAVRQAGTDMIYAIDAALKGAPTGTPGAEGEPK